MRTKVTFILLLLQLTGCSSMPIRSVPQPKVMADILPLGDVSIIGCEEYQLAEHELDCEARSVTLARMLEKTKLFNKVVIGEPKADYLVELKPYSRYPYYFGIDHNPGVFLLSAAVPFWESYEYGYDFTISKVSDATVHRINTLETGTHLMWSASILINMLPSRGIPGTFYENEILHLKNTIINTLK